MANPNTLTYYHYQDIQVADTNLQQELISDWQDGQYSQALSVLSSNASQLQGKAFIADLLNILSTGVLDLETKYNNAVPIFLSNLALQYNNLINNFLNKSTWNSTLQYIPFNFVIYNNAIYMCIETSPIGTLPTNTQYWLYLGLQGNTGAPGLNVNMRYTWNVANTYNVNDLVVYNQNIYVALVQNSGVTPGSNNSTWALFIVINPGEINVGTTAPTDPVQNEIWFQTQVDPLTQTTTTPLIGQFYRYNTSINNWEEMYPNILFRNLDGYNNYTPQAIFINLEIQPNQWQNQQFIYSYPTLNDNSFVQVYPANGISSSQYNIYSGLSISVNGYNITFDSAIESPNVSVPVLIKIQ